MPQVSLLDSNWQLLMNYAKDAIGDLLHDEGRHLTSTYPQEAATELRPKWTCTKLFVEHPMMEEHPLVVVDHMQKKFDPRSFVMNLKTTQLDEQCKP